MDEIEKSVLFISDTTNWYHWGCYGTSSVISSVYESEGYKVESIGLDDLYMSFLGKKKITFKRNNPSIIILNGEGTIHGDGDWAIFVVRKTLEIVNFYRCEFHIINHSCFNLGSRLLPFCETLYGMAHKIVVRDQKSFFYLKELGVNAELGFDCLFYNMQSLVVSQNKSSFEGSVIITSSSASGADILRYVRTYMYKLLKEYSRIVVLSGSFSNSTYDEKNLYTELMKIDVLNKRLEFIYSDNFYDWCEAIRNCKLLVTGRFHYLMAAIAAKKKNVIVFPANSPKNEAVLNWVLEKTGSISSFGEEVSFENIDELKIVNSIKKNFSNNFDDKKVKELLRKRSVLKSSYTYMTFLVKNSLKGKIRLFLSYLFFNDTRFEYLITKRNLRELFLKKLHSLYRKRKKIHTLYKMNTSSEIRELFHFICSTGKQKKLLLLSPDNKIKFDDFNNVVSIIDLLFYYTVPKNFWCCLNFSSEPAHVEGQLLTGYYNNKGAETYCVQHGGNKISTISGLISSPSKNIMVWSKKIETELNNIFLNELIEKRVTSYKRQVFVPQTLTTLEKITIVLATCLHTEYDLLKDRSIYDVYLQKIAGVISKLKSAYDFEFIYIPHPNDKVDCYLKYFSINSKKENIYAYLKQPKSIILSRASTVLEEAINEGRFAIGFDIFKNGPLAEYKETLQNNSFFTTFDENELYSSLEKCLKFFEKEQK